MAETEAHISSEEDQLFRLLRQLDIAPDAPQRATAEAVGLSLGRLNALLRDAIDQGFVRITQRPGSDKRQRNSYALTLPT